MSEVRQMSQGWETTVSDPDDRRVFEALSDQNWDFRTVDGIVKATNLSADDVREILRKHHDLIRMSPVPDRNGRELYTLRSRPHRLKEYLSQLRTVFSKTST